MATRLSQLLLSMQGTAASQQIMGRAGRVTRKKRRKKTTTTRSSTRRKKRSTRGRKKTQAQIQAERLKNLAKARRARKRKRKAKG